MRTTPPLSAVTKPGNRSPSVIFYDFMVLPQAENPTPALDSLLSRADGADFEGLVAASRQAVQRFGGPSVNAGWR
jgi:hypothetical protein